MKSIKSPADILPNDRIGQLEQPGRDRFVAPTLLDDTRSGRHKLFARLALQRQRQLQHSVGHWHFRIARIGHPVDAHFGPEFVRALAFQGRRQHFEACD